MRRSPQEFSARLRRGPRTLAQPDAAKPDGKPDMVEKRMREKEPMSGGMKREGMMKEEVRMHAEKKDKMMREAMKREETEKEQAKK